MEAKKNSRADINSHRPKFFLIGLMLSISLVITAFEWKTRKQELIVYTFDSAVEIIPNIPITEINLPKAPEPPSSIPVKTNQSIVPSVIVTSTAPNDAQSDDIKIDLGSTSTNVTLPVESNVDADTTSILVFAEQQPEPIGGISNFYKILSENIKYPSRARSIGIEGKVLVEFVVDRKGNATNLKISRGIGAGCDEEAMRVVALPKWQPGKQRGRAVNVKMVVPVHFQLRN